MSQLPGLSRETRESIAMYHLRVPQTEEELERYYQFRWEMLRKPLHQPKGSERDAWDAMAHHQMVVDEQGNLVAVGRLYINADNEASIRFMAVHPDVQDKGLGTLMAMTLESVARQEGRSEERRVRRGCGEMRRTPARNGHDSYEEGGAGSFRAR